MPGIDVNTVLDRVEALPELPRLVKALHEVASRADGRAAGLAELAAAHPQHGARLLRIVNSIYYSYPDPVATVAEAVGALGFELVRNLLLGIAFIDAFRGGDTPGFDRARLWQHSLAAARAVELVSERLGDEEETRHRLFVAALLHDVGIVVLEHCFPEQFAGLLAACRNALEPYVSVEAKVIGPLTHDRIGKLVAEKWELPDAYTDAIAFHHSPEGYAGPHERDVHLVHLAHYVAELSGVGRWAGTPPNELHPRSSAVLGLANGDLKDLTRALLAQEREIMETVDMLVGKEDADKAGKGPSRKGPGAKGAPRRK